MTAARSERGAMLQPAGLELARKPRRKQCTEDDAEVHHRGDVGKDALLQRRSTRRRLPITPGRDIDPECGDDLGTPKRECGRDAPRPAREIESREVCKCECDSAGEQRPGPVQKS